MSTAISTSTLSLTPSEPGAIRSVSPTSCDSQWKCEVCGGKPILKTSRASHLISAKHVAAVAEAAAAAEEALLVAEQKRKQIEENEQIVAEAKWNASLKAEKKQQKKLAQQEITDTRAALERAQETAKQTNATLQGLMKMLAAASEANENAEKEVLLLQQTLLALL